MLRDDLDPPLFSTKRVRGCHASGHRVGYARDTDRSRIEPVQIPSRHCGLNIGEIERDCVGSTLPWRAGPIGARRGACTGWGRTWPTEQSSRWTGSP